MANFTLQVETAASKAKANPPQKDLLFYILPPLIVAAVFAVVYGVTPPESATAPESATPPESVTAPKEAPAEEAPAEVPAGDAPAAEAPAEEVPADSE